MAEIQRQMGIFNPQMADAAREWGPRIAGLGSLVALLAAFGDTYAKCSVDGGSSTGSSLGNSDGSSREDDGETPEGSSEQAEDSADNPEGSASSSDEATDEVAPTDSK